jgi:hypothetical protein
MLLLFLLNDLLMFSINEQGFIHFTIKVPLFSFYQIVGIDVDASLLNKSENPSTIELIVAMEESKDSVCLTLGTEKRNSFARSPESHKNNGKYEIQNISNQFIVVNPNIDNPTKATDEKAFLSSPRKVDKFSSPADIPSLQKTESKRGSLLNFMSKFSNSFYLKQIKVSSEKKEIKEREIKNIASPELLFAAKAADIEIDDLGMSVVTIHSLIPSFLFFYMTSIISFSSF